MTVYGCWRLRDLKAILSGTMRESTMIMMIIAASFLFSYVMSDLGITQKTAGWLVSLGLGQWQFFLWSCVFMVISASSCAGRHHSHGHAHHPAVAQGAGIDLIWYGVIVTILMEMGLIHPPVGLNLFVIQGIAPDIKMRSIIWARCRLFSSWCSVSCCCHGSRRSPCGCRPGDGPGAEQRQSVPLARRRLHGCTTPWMEEVERRRELPPRRYAHRMWAVDCAGSWQSRAMPEQLPRDGGEGDTSNRVIVTESCVSIK